MSDDPLVARVVKKIAEAVHPKQIILFGSRARGTPHPESDVDLVVVYDGPEDGREVELRIRNLFSLPEFSLDLIVMRPEELERQRHVANTLAREIAERGVPVYG